MMMLLIEYMNVLTRGKWQTHLAKHRWSQYLLAALLGATPGCLGAFAAVGMYSHGALTHGAVIAAMIATMGDETFVMFMLIPKHTFLLICILIGLGVLVGALSDAIASRWMPLRHVDCEGMETHASDSCQCFPRGQLLRQWQDCSVARGVLAAFLLLYILGLLSGHFGPVSWNWMRFTLLATSSFALMIVSTVPDHFLDEHLWKHVVLKHVPRTFLWTFGALLIMSVLIEQLHLDNVLERGKWLVLIVACIIGIIPESGPHLIFVTLFSQGALPFSILLASSIVQDGHGMLPLLAQSRRTFLGIKAVNCVIGFLIGGTLLMAGY